MFLYPNLLRTSPSLFSNNTKGKYPLVLYSAARALFLSCIALDGLLLLRLGKSARTNINFSLA